MTGTIRLPTATGRLESHVREKLFSTGRIRHHALPKGSAAFRKVWNVKDNHTLTIREVARVRISVSCRVV